MATTRKNTKNKILQKALELFSQTGFGGTSVRDISGSVGIRESAIYNHFKSKEDIIKEIIVRKIQDSAETKLLSEDLINDLINTHSFLSVFAEKLIRLWSEKEERYFFRLLLMEQYRDNTENSRIFETYFKNLRSLLWMIFDELIKHKLIKQNDPTLLTNEYLNSLVIIRLEYLCEISSFSTSHEKAIDDAQKHVDFLWQSIKK